MKTAPSPVNSVHLDEERPRSSNQGSTDIGPVLSQILHHAEGTPIRPGQEPLPRWIFDERLSDKEPLARGMFGPDLCGDGKHANLRGSVEEGIGRWFVVGPRGCVGRKREKCITFPGIGEFILVHNGHLPDVVDSVRVQDVRTRLPIVADTEEVILVYEIDIQILQPLLVRSANLMTPMGLDHAPLLP